MALGEKAKSGNLAVEDMDGGTFTISNGGVFGAMFGTPIINPPQSAILGMHGIFDRPVARNGQVRKYALNGRWLLRKTAFVFVGCDSPYDVRRLNL